jgi:hypothetical protein
MLGRHVAPDHLLDSISLVLAAKVLDEVDGDAAFEASPGEPRVSASRFDDLVDAAAVALGGRPGAPSWNGVEVPELVAHQILQDLGSYSLLRTADLPGGRAAVRGLFAGAAGASATGSSSIADPALVAGLQRLADADRDRRSLAGVAAAAADVFGLGTADAPAPRADEVLDLREREVTPRRHRHRS